MKKVRRFHFRARAFEKIERTKRIARSLDKEDWRSQSAENFITKFFLVAHGAEWISKTHDRIHLFLQRDMTSDAPAHALADQYGRVIGSLSILRERRSMRRDQLRQRIGPLPIFPHVIIIENRHSPDVCQARFPGLHPRMRRRRSRARSEKEKGRRHLGLRIEPRLN